MKNFEVALQITTPLALAALCLLLGAGLLKTLSKGRSSVALQMTIRWGFILSIILGVLANASYLVIGSFGREVRVAGTVRDDTDNPVPNAIVDLGGKTGRAITDDYGEFELDIPESRVAPDYKAVIRADEFEATNILIQGPRPRGEIEVILHRPTFTSSDFARFEATGAAKHYLGVPQVDLIVDLSNPYSRRIILGNILLTLTSPSGKLIPLRLQGTFIPPGGSIMPSPLSEIPLDKSQIWTLGFSFANSDPGIGLELEKMQREVPTLSAMPIAGQDIYSESLVQDLRDFMKSRMIWNSGEWNGELDWSVEGNSFKRSFQFALSNDDISSMDNITNYYGSGFGVIPSLQFAQVYNANPAIMVQIKPLQ